MISVHVGPVPGLLDLVHRHPLIEAMHGPADAALEWTQGDWRRRLWIGQPDFEVAGLVELIDNNPLVCADEASVPDPASTLALIALGPLIRAGLLVEPPALQFSFDSEASLVDDFLRAFGWNGGAVVDDAPQDLGSAVALNAFAVVRTPEDPRELDELYEEAYGRSFFVQEAGSEPWDARRVADYPRALYRLRMAPDEASSLLTIQVMADRHGKCGAAQALHAFNVMCGFEESLGLG
jgi:hypothetical protein